MAADWKKMSLFDLVSKLREIVDSKFKELQRALIGRGSYQIFPETRNETRGMGKEKCGIEKQDVLTLPQGGGYTNI